MRQIFSMEKICSGKIYLIEHWKAETDCFSLVFSRFCRTSKKYFALNGEKVEKQKQGNNLRRKFSPNQTKNRKIFLFKLTVTHAYDTLWKK